MNKPVRFRRRESTRDLQRYLQSKRDWERSVPPQPCLERFAFHKFHRIEAFLRAARRRPVLECAVMKNARHIRMAQARSGPRFTQKTGAGIRFRGKPGVDHLERDGQVRLTSIAL